MFRRITVAAPSSGSALAVATAVRMYSVTAKEIQTLRYRTEAPMTDCKKALVASEGDMEEAVKWLQKNGAAKANKKGDRVTDNGSLLAAISPQGKGAAIVQVCSETDFALRNDRFLDFTQEVQQVAQRTLDDYLFEYFNEFGLSQEEQTARADAVLEAIKERSEEARKQAVAVLGENITVKGLQLMPSLSNDEGKAVISLPTTEGVISQDKLFGFYCHNNPSQNHKYVGSIASIVQLQPRNPDGAGLPSGADATIPASELAQHCVANMFNDSPITQQNMLGTSETAGQWMKRFGVKLQRAMILQMGKEPTIHKISAPYEGKKE